MTVQAQTPDEHRRLLCLRDPAALTALRPCRFCGQADMLTFHHAYDVRLAYVGNRIARDGDAAEEEVFDAVECHSCCVTAPFDVWQSDGDIYSAAQRQAYADFLAGEGGHAPLMADAA